MKRISSFVLLLLGVATTVMAGKETYHIEARRPLTTRGNTTKVKINMDYMATKFGYQSSDEMPSISANGAVKMQAEVWGTSDVFTTFTNGTSGSTGFGHWFCADGTPAKSASDASRRVAAKLLNGEMYITHRNNAGTSVYNNVGDEFRFAELFIHDADTIRYEFHVVLTDGEESATCDQKSYTHRADQTEGLPMMAKVQQNNKGYKKQNWLQVNVGDKITLDAVLTDTTQYDSIDTQWKLYGKSTVLRAKKHEPFVLTESATTDLCGQYEMTAYCYKKSNHRPISKTMPVYIDVQENAGEGLDWTGKVPTFSYNFKDEYGEIPAPQNILGEVGETDKYGKPVNRVSGEWWTVCWGSNLNTECGTDTATVYQAARNLIKKYDTDFAYIRDVMGWPPDIRARMGYKSTVYIFGSGLKCDDADNQTQGGYQSAIWYSDPKTGVSMNWPCVWASYYPFSRFRSDADQIFTDGEYQREAMIHEGIHALFADMDGVKQSAWFHEAGNTWLQSAMAVRRTGVYGTPGFLDGCPFVAPFMPIECYSGWLQDGSFGGPSAEGVNMYNSSGQQICTWRTYLGGNQYGNAFPIILSVMCGDGSIPWIWRYCKTRVLSGIGDYIGDEGMRTLIMQYRARQACFDFGGWSSGYRKITSDYFNVSMGPEWEPHNVDCSWQSTCYQKVKINDDDRWLAPDVTVNPGWSGANIIPIHVDTKKDRATVIFRPEDSEERAMLCYKTKTGKCYYSQIVRCGEMSIDITDDPANGVIFCVVCNTDYRYTGEEQRKHHYDYRIHLGKACKGIGDQYKKWFMNEQNITDEYEDISEEETEVLRGDANNDSSVTMADVMFVVNSILGTPSDGFNADGADANLDGRITMSDVMYIVNYILNGFYPSENVNVAEFEKNFIEKYVNK